jgi:putative flippase GtrA
MARGTSVIKRELAIFLVVGSLTVLVDFLSYRGLVWMNMLETNSAKGLGFLTGTGFAYFANRIWTFGHKKHAPGSAWRFALLYAFTLGINIFINAVGLRAFHQVMLSVQISFLLTTSVSTALNFAGMKYFVFKTRSTSSAVI